MKELSDTLKREFTVFYNLPIPMVEHNFYYYLEILNPIYRTLEKHNDFLIFIQQLENKEQSYFDLAKAQKEHIFDLFETPMVLLGSFNTQQYTEQDICKNIKNGNVYTHQNAGKWFLSIDLVKANFQAMKFIAKEMKNESGENAFTLLMDNLNTYDDLFLNDEKGSFFRKSKKLRQYIFGNLFPKKQQAISKFIISKLNALISENINLNDDLIRMNSDELILTMDDAFTTEQIKALFQADPFLSQFNFHFDEFKLELVHPEHKFYIKHFKNGTVEFKNIPKQNLCEVIKYLSGEPLVSQDLQFLSDGRLAEFKTRLF